MRITFKFFRDTYVWGYYDMRPRNDGLLWVLALGPFRLCGEEND